MSHRPRFISFQLVTDNDAMAEITVNPEYIESFVDGQPFNHGITTQINMISGTKFFVRQSYPEVKDSIKLILGV